MPSIEDEAAEAAEVSNLMAAGRRNSQIRNGYDLESRRMSKASGKRSHRSSVGGNSSHNGSESRGMTTTTQAEVIAFKYMWSFFALPKCTCFGSTYTKIGTIQRRLAWPLRKDDTQNREAFHIFCPQLCELSNTLICFCLTWNSHR